MIERKYTGIAKQGADVVANPTLDGTEQALDSIRINGENFKIEGGGSGKLKLVAEGNIVVDSSSGTQIVVNINHTFEDNKLYLLELYHAASDWHTTAVIKLECNSSIPFADENEQLSNLIVRVYNELNGAKLLIQGTTSDIIYGDETYKIYEITGVGGGSENGFTSTIPVDEIMEYEDEQGKMATLMFYNNKKIDISQAFKVTLNFDNQDIKVYMYLSPFTNTEDSVYIKYNDDDEAVYNLSYNSIYGYDLYNISYENTCYVIIKISTLLSEIQSVFEDYIGADAPESLTIVSASIDGYKFNETSNPLLHFEN